MKPLTALSLAAAVVRYTDAGDVLLSAAARLECDEPLNYWEWTGLSACVRDLSHIDIEPYIKENRPALESAKTPNDDQPLTELASGAQYDAKAVYRCLQDVHLMISELPEGHPFRIRSVGLSRKELKRLLASLSKGQKRQVHVYNASVAAARSKFLTSWTDNDLAARLKAIPHYRAELNPSLLLALNLSLQDLQSNLTVDGPEISQEAALQSDDNEIIQILSLHLLAKPGLPAVAAVLKRRNSKAVFIFSDNDLPIGNPVTSDGKCITYNMAVQDMLAPMNASSLAPNFGGVSRSYGEVIVSGSGLAHLGDTHLNGTINIQQIFFPPRQHQQGDIQSATRYVNQQEGGVPATSNNETKTVADNLHGPKPLAQNVRPVQILHPTSVVEIIKAALHFREENYRISDVKEAHYKTFDWVFHHSPLLGNLDFPSWLESGHRCFWVEGKAGSGKSTLMKYIRQNSKLEAHLMKWAGRRQLIIGTFFFWYSGSRLQNSYEGILRSLLYQILQERPELAQILFTRTYMHLLSSINDNKLEFTIEELRQAIDIFIKQLTPDLALFVMIDGVDEYSGDCFEFCKFLVHLSDIPTIKLLVSSRPIPECYHVFSCFPTLHVQDLTVDDIRNYIEEELINDNLLQQMDAMSPGFARKVKEELTSKASGVFLWLIIVVRELLIGLGNYDGPVTLMQKIDHLPSDLEKLYDHMFTKMPVKYQREGSMLLQITKRALALQRSVYTALQVSFTDESSSYLMAENSAPDIQKMIDMRINIIDGRLRSRCCGLIEVQYKRGGAEHEAMVDFLHRTVAEYLNKNDVWQKIQGLNSMTQEEVDQILLRTVRCASAELGPIPVGRLEFVLHDCFIYSRQLSDRGNNDYGDDLYTVESLFLQCCMEQGWGFEAYNEFYYNRLGPYKKKLKGMPFSHFQFLDSLNWAMFCIAIRGLPAFWRLKLNSVGPFDRPNLLCRLLNLALIEDDVAVETYLENIQILLEETDPNACVPDFAQELSLKQTTEPQSAGSKGISELTSWLFWLDARSNGKAQGHVFWRITLYLLRAGAALKAGKSPRKSVLRQLINDARARRKIRTIDQNEEIVLLDEIIARLSSISKLCLVQRKFQRSFLRLGI